MKHRIILAAGLLVACIMPAAHAAPVWLQDYGAPGNLDEPFNRAPDASGTSEGILDDDAPNAAGSSAIALDTTSGALGTLQSATLTIVDEAPPAADSAGANVNNNDAPASVPTAYTIRLIPNANANLAGANTAFASDGYVGFYLKADPSAAAALLHVAPLLEPTVGGTFASDGGILKPVIADGRWHLYEWNMDNQADFPNSFGGLLGGAGDTNQGLGASVFFDAIAMVSFGVDGLSSATLNIDQIGYDNQGRLPPSPVIPEPATIALIALGLLGLSAGNRRRAA